MGRSLVKLENVWISKRIKKAASCDSKCDVLYFTMHAPAFWKARPPQTILTGNKKKLCSCGLLQHSGFSVLWSRVLGTITFVPTEETQYLHSRLIRSACTNTGFEDEVAYYLQRMKEKDILWILMIQWVNGGEEGRRRMSDWSHYADSPAQSPFKHKVGPWSDFLPAVSV